MKFLPEEYINKVFPKKIRKFGLLTSDLAIKRNYLKSLVIATGIDGRTIKATIYKVIKVYESKIKELKGEGVKAFKSEALNDEVLLNDRVDNLIKFEKVQDIRDIYEGKGKKFEWLPSSAVTPDPEHQLNYGKIFDFDSAKELPGERYGCQCGMNIL